MRLVKNIKNSKGQIADIIMFLFFISFVVYFIVSYTSMQVFFKTQEIIDGIVRTEVEVVRTKGLFTTDEYKSFLKKLNGYGNFEVFLTLEAQDLDGKYIKYFTPEEILDKPLQVGDFVKIFVESKDRPLFAEMMSRNFMLAASKGGGTNFRMQSLCTGMVCSDGFIRGLQVVDTITKYTNTPNGVTVTTLKGGNFTYKGGTVYNVDTPDTDPNWIDIKGKYMQYINRNTSTNDVIGVEINQLNR